MDKYREIGRRFGSYLRECNPSTPQIQAFLGDLLAEDDLLLPMKDAVARPCFAPLKTGARSGTGTTQRQALLQELGRSYLPVVVEHIRQVLDGMLELASGEAASVKSSANWEKSKSDLWEDTPRPFDVPWDTNQGISVQALAKHLGVETDRIIGFLHMRGVLATASQTIDPAVALTVLEELDNISVETRQNKLKTRLERSMAERRAETKSHETTESNRLSAAICDDTIWNPQRDPKLDKRFLEAWNLTWFNKRYRPRLEKD